MVSLKKETSMNDKPYYYLVKASTTRVLKTIPDRLKERVMVQPVTQDELVSLLDGEFLPYTELDGANIFDRTLIISEWCGQFTTYRFKPVVVSPNPTVVEDGGYW